MSPLALTDDNRVAVPAGFLGTGSCVEAAQDNPRPPPAQQDEGDDEKGQRPA